MTPLVPVARAAEDEGWPAGPAGIPPGITFAFPQPRTGIGRRRTDITGFVGIAARGPLHTPTRIETWGAFVATFGGHVPHGYLAYAVEAFFANGGRTAWVVRVASPMASPGSLTLLSGPCRPAVRLTATSPGGWSHRVAVRVTLDGDRSTLIIRGPGEQELWRDLGTAPDDHRRIDTVLSASRLVRAEILDAAPPLAGGPWFLHGGDDGTATLSLADLTGEGAGPPRGLAALEAVTEIGLLAVPDLMTKPVTTARRRAPRRRCDLPDEPPSPVPRPGPCDARDDAPVAFPAPFPPADIARGQQALIAQCERRADRFAILDPPLDADDPGGARAWIGGLPRSPFAAGYFPWVLAPDPLELAGVVRAVPPSGHVAGLYARTDLETGVHKAPANERVEKTADVAYHVDDRSHGEANDACLNILRPYPGRGLRVAGARTLHCRAPWRFVNVRRLLTMIQVAVSRDLAWCVFEPNRPDLWLEVDRLVRGFLDDLWRRGMLDGASAEEAYDVRCDGETNPPAEVDAGRLTCLIGVLPPPPAEFVRVRVTLTPEGTEALRGGTGDG